MSNKMYYDDDFKGFSLKYLHKITKYLRFVGYLIFLITSINLILFLSSLSPRIFPFKEASLFSIFFTFFCFGVTIYYENLRKRGEAIFEEISDELQWHIGYRDSLSNKEPSTKKPEFEIRVALRSFARTTDIPLIPGKFGPALYIGINIVISFFTGYLGYIKY
ncbi:MAG: hypothetical protein K9M96_09380 [Deltaproteobacteria bacterium]|nr:hypothetical protein [Desulfobacterales bacterium]MCF8083295.1 hypothetical protein [Deltaproteobacteria bacterium]